MDIRKDIVVLDGLVGDAGWLIQKPRDDRHVVFHRKPTDVRGQVFAELEVYIDFFDDTPSVFINIKEYTYDEKEVEKYVEMIGEGDTGTYDGCWYAVNFSLGDPDCAQKLQTAVKKIMKHWKEEYGFRA